MANYKGHPQSETARKAISLKAKRRYRDNEEVRQQVDNAHLGFTHSDKSRSRISQALKERWNKSAAQQAIIVLLICWLFIGLAVGLPDKATATIMAPLSDTITLSIDRQEITFPLSIGEVNEKLALNVSVSSSSNYSVTVSDSLAQGKPAGTVNHLTAWKGNVWGPALVNQLLVRSEGAYSPMGIIHTGQSGAWAGPMWLKQTVVPEDKSGENYRMVIQISAVAQS